MNLFSKILQALVKTHICPLPKTQVLIFDSMGSDILEKLILQDIKYAILPARYEKFYISREILFNFIKNFIGRYLRYKKYRSLYFIYLLSCVECIEPKIVITFIDNNFLFHMISSVYRKAVFYTIQNGTRDSDSLPAPLLFGTVFPISNYVCFGDYEVDFYNRHGYIVDKFHPVGSLIGGYYKSEVLRGKSDNKFDLCLVSQWRRSIMFGNQYPEFKASIATLDNFLKRFIDETRLTLCIAACSNDQQEKDYFKRIYGNHAQIINLDRTNGSTYLAMDNSSVILTFCSTAAYEAFGWGKKVLFCNFSGDCINDFSLQGFWSLRDNRYESFKVSLEYLLNLDYSKYVDFTREAARYVMNYDFEMPAHKYIRKRILECLSN